MKKKTLQDYKEEYDELNEKKNLSGKAALEAVKQNGNALQFVAEQTEEICLEAVKQEGYVLRYVAEQTEEICLAAVKQEGDALRFVNVSMFGKDCANKESANDVIELNGVKYKRID